MALQYLLAPTFQFVNTAGKPLSGGAYMEVYVHGTRTKYFCASDFNGTLHPFRIPLDSLGSNIVLANDTGSYDVYAYNRYGTLMMSRYNVKPGAGGGIGGTITSTDGSIDIHPTEDGVDLSVNGLDPSCLKVSADPRTTDGKFYFDTLVKEGDQAYVDNEGAIRLIKGWYHFTANVQLAWNAGARNETHQVTLYTTLSNSVIDFDISHVHTETIELSGDVSIAQDGSELVIGVSGMPVGLEASVISMDVHAITGKDGHDKYYAGNGITISNENYVAVDFDEVQEKLVAGSGVTIEGNVISAPTLVQAQADWTEEDTESRAYIKHKPDLDVFATKTEVNTGLAGKQNTIPDLAAIRSGAQAGASAVQPADLAAVATTGSYNDLNHRPNLDQYATDQELTSGLATKQDTISDLATIRSGAAAGATAVQPAELATVATTGDYDDLTDKPDLSVYATTQAMNTALAGKQDTINDLSTIRSGAAAGATALQPADVATVATTGDYDDLIDKPDLSVYATTQDLTTGLASKQDTISDLADIRSGAAEGATAVQPGDLATVATSGSYNDLSDKPSIPAAQVNSDWNASSGVSEILNKPQLSTVATTGDYDDLVNKPSIPAAQVNSDWNAVSGVSEILNKPALATVATSGSYTDLSNTPSIPTATSDLTNDSGFITSSDIPVTGVEVDGTSVVNANGVAEITMPTIPVTDVEVDGASVVNASGVAEITLPTFTQAQADWTEADTTDPSYIQNKPNLATVATTGAYSDLTGTPTIPAAQVNSDWNASSGVAEILNKPSLAAVATSGSYTDLTDKPSIPAAQVNADWNSSSGVSEILNKPTIPSGAQLVPAATSADADKVLTVDAQGTPAWASAQAPISAGDGISITNNVVSAKVDGTTVSFNASGELQAAAAVTVDQTYNAASTNAQSGTAVAQAVATKEDAFDVGTGLEMDTTGATPTLQVEAPVDIVAGPGIVVDNPDGNTLRVSQASNYEVTLWTGTYSGSVSDSNYITLSENPANFDTVEITIGGGYKSRFRFAGNSTTWSFMQSYANTSSTTIYAARFDRSATTVTCKAANYMQIGANQVNSWQNRDMNVGELQITQVVGIHRTASN